MGCKKITYRNFSILETVHRKNATAFKKNRIYGDHLGNIRLSYKNTGTTTTPVLNIQEENNYYPFGLKHKGYNGGINGVDHKYGFGGMEEQDDDIGGNKLDWLDFGARNYDAALGRWMNLDPLAEQMRRHSPYNYAFDNPIVFSDPDGMAPFTDLFDEKGNKIGSDGVDNGANVIVNNDDLVKQVKKVNSKDGKVDLLDDQFAFNGDDITILPDESTLKEGLNVLKRTEDNGGLREESSVVINNGDRISRSETGPAPTISTNENGDTVMTAESKVGATLLLGERATASIHSHLSEALESNGLVFPLSTGNPTPGVDTEAFKNYSTNIIVGRIGKNVSRGADGKLIDNRPKGMTIYNSSSKPQITLTRRVVNKILRN